MKIKKYKNFGILLFILIITIAIIPNFIITLLDNIIEKDSPSAYSFSQGDIYSLGIVFGEQRQKIEWTGSQFGPEDSVTGYGVVDGKTVPKQDPYILYCTEYGTGFWTGNGTRHYATSLEGSYGTIEHYYKSNPHESITYTGKWHCTGIHIEQKYDGELSFPWLVKESDINLIKAGGDENISLAYALTSKEIDKYSEEKQMAIWALKGQRGQTSLSEEAKQYAKYYEKTQVDRGSTELPDLDIKGSAEDLKVLAHYDEQKGGTLTIGPINLTYINQNNDSIAFEGISAMYFRGYNKKGEMVKGKTSADRIKVEYVIDSNGKYVPKFFNPKKEECYVDHNKQAYPDGQGDGEFYLVIKDPNIGKTSKDEDFIAELDLRITFKWMTIFDAQVSNFNSYEYQVNWYEHLYPITHSDPDYSYNLETKRWEVSGYHSDSSCLKRVKLEEASLQKVLCYYGGGRELFTTTFTIGNVGERINITMDLGGNVWEDGLSTKESKADGLNSTPAENGNNIDKNLSNIKVSLWKVQKAGSIPGEFITYTYTNENGNYMFTGLNPLLKYYVSFEYDGQKYLSTEYLNAGSSRYDSVNDMINAGEYNGSDIWHATSKGTETSSEREAYNQRFSEIGSAPKNYPSDDSLSSGALVESYNEAFSMYDLMGFKLDENGKYYIDSNLALIDGYYTVENGNIVVTNKYQKGRISQEIEKYIKQYSDSEKSRMRSELEALIAQQKADWNKKVDEAKVTQENNITNDLKGNSDYTDSYGNLTQKGLDKVKEEVQKIENQRSSGLSKIEKQKEVSLEYIEKLEIVPDYNTMIKDVYKTIAGSDTNMWRKLQFIEDSKISSYTQNNSEKLDLYPVYDDFYLNYLVDNDAGTGKKKYDTIEDQMKDSYDQTIITVDGIDYKPIYEGQFFVNLGLWKRQQNNMSIRKDIYRAATRINGKTEVYKYNKREDNKDYWEIQLRMSDYEYYYGGRYNRELYKSDYEYDTKSTNLNGSNLELYVTYKISLRNTSQGIINEITEVVDYYDKDYTYVPDLSWVMYTNSGNDEEMSVPEDSYYNMIHKLDRSNIKYAKEVNGKENSKYGTASQSDIEKDYNSLYIQGLQNKKLATGEEAYIYLTFKVNLDNNGHIILDEDDSLKENLVEINGFKNYYNNGTNLPNNVTISGDSTPAGLIDFNSTPGNLEASDLIGERYEKNFEDDTDRAKSLKVFLDENAVRYLKGTVWEDKRTQNVSNAIIGDGVRQAGEIGIAGVEVDLVEKMTNGNEYIWQKTTTGADGTYEFSSYIPGDYIVRFKYGSNNSTVLTKEHGGSNAVSYNGQDFKSTIYSKDLKNNKVLLDNNEKYYNILEADKLSLNQKLNLSDAKDLWERRTEVNNYSTSNVTNHKAEVLSSPYAQTIDNNNISELITNTNMVAETPIIVVEGEYDRTKTDGYNTESNGNDLYLFDNDANGNFILNNVDFGLTERPKAGLELNKKITNLKLTLSNQSVIFDTNQTVKNLSWSKGKEYNLANNIKGNKYEEYYEESKTNSQYNRYSYRSEISNIINSLYLTGKNGLLQVVLDQELMHGATIEITYDLTVKNIGETDYVGQDFYYLGTGASTIVLTSANTVLDYISNNLQYREVDNTGWAITTSEEVLRNGLVNNRLADNVKKYSNIITTSQLNTNLKPGDEVSKKLILSQTMSTNNGNDNKVYENISEIVETSNTVGRRMAYSIVGNQNPDEIPTEVDSSKAEQVVVIPPFGSQNYVYYIIAISIVIVLAIGIILIKTKVLRRKDTL